MATLSSLEEQNDRSCIYQQNKENRPLQRPWHQVHVRDLHSPLLLLLSRARPPYVLCGGLLVESLSRPALCCYQSRVTC